MAQKGLNNDLIMEAAMRLVEEKGYDNFSLRELAARLEVKPASLYNHVAGIGEINTAVAVRAADMLNQTLLKAVEDKGRDEAFLDATRAYRLFAKENPEIYKALIRMPASDDEYIVKAAFASFAPLRAVIRSYGADHASTVHFIRILRSAMHGFVELTENGFMQRDTVTKDETYEELIHGFLNILKGLAKNEEI